MGMQDLQNLINEMTKWKKEIENMHVDLQSKQIQIKMREDGTEMLQEKRELLDEQKKQKEEENEDLEKQSKAKEEAAKKRHIAKLQRDKNPEVKDLNAKEEEQTEANEDFRNKFRNETEKTSKLLDELIQIKENLRLTKILKEETIKKNAEEEKEIKDLTVVINDKQAVVTKLVQKVDYATKQSFLNE